MSGRLRLLAASVAVLCSFAVSAVAADDPGGALKWIYETGLAIDKSSPAIGPDGTIYVGNGGHFTPPSPDLCLYAFNRDGTLKWKYSIGNYVYSPVVDGTGAIYVQDATSTLWAFNPDGTLKWKYVLSTPFDTDGKMGLLAPAIDSDGTIYIAADSVYAINPTGTLKWRYAVGPGLVDIIRTAPALGPTGTIYVGAMINTSNNPPLHQYLWALNRSGTLVWQYDLGAGFAASSPSVDADGTIYVGTSTLIAGGDSYFYAFNPNGTVKWRYFIAQWEIRSSATIAADGTIYIGTRRNVETFTPPDYADENSDLYAFHPDGTLKWKFNVPSHDEYSSATVGADGVVYIGDNLHHFWAVNPDGTARWSYESVEGIAETSAALDTDGTLYYGNNRGQLFARATSSPGLANTPWPKFHHDVANTGSPFFPSITAQPSGATVSCCGNSGTFTVTASGSGLTYQWQASSGGGASWSSLADDGSRVSGATTATLTYRVDATTDDLKRFRCLVNNRVGTNWTTAAVLSVPAAPVITTNPASVTAVAGGTATFTAAASGSLSSTVQWQVAASGTSSFVDIAGATSASYSLTVALADSGKQYRAVFTNTQGSSATIAATLTVVATAVAPVVTLNPVAVAAPAGQMVSFTAAATGTPAPSVKWQSSFDGTTFLDVNDSASTTYSFAVAASDSGKQFRAVFTNSAGSAASTPATLTVADSLAPVLQSSPTHVSVRRGMAATFGAAASGSPTPTVQWQVSTDRGVSFTDIAGATSTSYSLTAAAGDNGKVFRAVFSNRSGTVQSGGARLTVMGDISAGPPSMRFVARKSGGVVVSATPAQTATVTFDGGGAAWTTTAEQPWIQLSSYASVGSGFFTIAIMNPNDVIGANTSLTGTVTIASPGAPNLATTISVALDVAQTSTLPYGSFDTPADLATGVTGAIPVTGWALDDLGVSRVMLWRNCIEAIDRPAAACVAAVPGGPPNYVYIGDGAFLAGARPDVEANNRDTPQAYRAGWGYLMLTNALPHVALGRAQGGQGTFQLYAYALDMEGQYQLLGSKTIGLDNDHATIPFGAIDTPTQGGTMTTSVYANFGWAMTQSGKCLDTTSTSAYKVYIDGVSRTLTPGTNWFPGLNRSDIAAAYPGLCNTNDALAAYYIDATALGLSNGLHTIGWDAIDSGGNVAGIGSRFFNVLIGSAAAPPERPVAVGRASELDGFAAVGGPETFALRTNAASRAGRSAGLSGPRSIQLPAGGHTTIDLGGPVDTGHLIVGDELRAAAAAGAVFR